MVKVSDDTRSKVEQAADAVDESLKGDDIEAIKDAVEKLSAESQAMGTAIYEAEAAQAGEAGDAGTADGGDPNVVDAEVVEDEEDEKK